METATALPEHPSTTIEQPPTGVRRWLTDTERRSLSDDRAARLAEQLQVDPDVIRSYGRRAKTRTDHLRLVAQLAGMALPGCTAAIPAG
ncbi:DUF4158 domain-containing protein [Sphaerisporangium sp. NPDC051017]|uniref:DUF4158 domain-containing protein n=1 Tax=Sphaerisporangium sp. NPDC051017 TaxID=3154636 RepID=UPI0034209E41